MTVDNSTGGPHALGPQLLVADIIVIAVYFALNVAVGIWVRGLHPGVGTERHIPAASAPSPGAAYTCWGPVPSPGVDLSETLPNLLSLSGQWFLNPRNEEEEGLSKRGRSYRKLVGLLHSWGPGCRTSSS